MTINFKSIDDRHSEEFSASAIDRDIAALNFRSFDGSNENELDEVFTLLIEDPNHKNNGTLAGKSQNDLANVLRSGGWIFEGDKGICVKPNKPRKDKEGKVIKYESPRGDGSLQLFIPNVSIGAAEAIAAKHGVTIERPEALDPSTLDGGFWEWYLSTELPIVITEGAKKACSLVSARYPAIALNGVWGWGTNDRDMFGNVEKDERGKSLKTIQPDLEPFLDGREIVLAFDRDAADKTKRMVKAAKAAFIRVTEDDDITVTQLVWRRPNKGIDDYIAARGVKELDKRYAKREEIETEEPKPERFTSGDTLLEIGKTATYFHTPDKVAYADVSLDGNRHTYKVRSQAFRLWLTGEYFDREEKGVSAQPLQDALNTLESLAIRKGETHEVHLRTAEHQGKIYLDLGSPDWKAIEVDATGWQIVSAPPVRFWRPDSLLSLPYPVEGGSLDELRELLNVDDSSWVQIVTFLMFCYLPNQVYPVLVLSAMRGSGKTTAAETIKGLIDPGKAPLIPLPNNTRDLAIAAYRRWLMVYDNVSHISNDESDNLCKLATGFGFTARKLHTDDEEITIECTRPQIITAIDSLVAREDLGDRVLMAQLREITADKRLSNSELKQKIYDSRPRIFGALLTALSQTLARLPQIQLVESPRMKDYALFAIAAERALGLKDGTFLIAFEESRETVRQGIIESSPVGEAILSFMRDKLVWKGTASELLKELETHTDDATYRSRYFPKAANHLSRQLNRLKPDLRALGIDVSDLKLDRNTKQIVLEKLLKVSSLSSPSSPVEKESLEPSTRAKKVGDDERSIETINKKLSSLPSLSSPPETHAEIDIEHLGDDRDDRDDKKLNFSGSDKSKVNGEDEGTVLSSSEAKSNVENHNFSNSSKVSPPSSFKVGDRVVNLQGQTGTILKFRTHTTPKGTKVPQALVSNLGHECKWCDTEILSAAEEVA